uniref:Putative peritrophin-1-like protein n=1 Tax=Culex tarsalis TaxID=7177 RepID=A0A1Q3FNV6_CULTA
MATLRYLVLFLSLVLIGAQEENLCEVEKCPHYGPTEVEHVLTLLPVPWNCSQYATCDREVQIIMSCPPGLHFNPALRVCDFPDRANCVERCTGPAS